MKEFNELKELTMFLKDAEMSRSDKKVLCDYFNQNDGLQDECFVLGSEDDVIYNIVESMKDETLVYFNTNFLMEYTDLHRDVIEAIKSLDHKGNDALVSIFNDRLEEMSQDAIACDGAGHFMNYYDGTNEEVYINGELYYFWFN